MNGAQGWGYAHSECSRPPCVRVKHLLSLPLSPSRCGFHFCSIAHLQRVVHQVERVEQEQRLERVMLCNDLQRARAECLLLIAWRVRIRRALTRISEDALILHAATERLVVFKEVGEAIQAVVDVANRCHCARAHVQSLSASEPTLSGMRTRCERVRCSTTQMACQMWQQPTRTRCRSRLRMRRKKCTRS